jgi:hypothetical protein
MWVQLLLLSKTISPGGDTSLSGPRRIWPLFRCGSQLLLLSKTITPGQTLRVPAGFDRILRGLGFRHSFAQIFGNTQDDAFDTFGGEAYSGQVCDGPPREAGAIVTPEDIRLLRSWSAIQISRWRVISWIRTASCVVTNFSFDVRPKVHVLFLAPAIGEGDRHENAVPIGTDLLCRSDHPSPGERRT